MKQDELKLVLEALKWCHGGEPCGTAEAIAVVEKALAQPEQEPMGDDWTPCMKLPVVVYVRKQRLGESHVSTREGITPVKPDDLIMRGVSGEEYPIGRAIFEQTYSLNTTPPKRTEQEPVAWRMPNWSNLHGKYGYRDFDDPVCGIDGKPSSKNEPLYTHSQRTWVGLTSEEIWDEWIEQSIPERNTHNFVAAFARAIEAKLKEVNT